MKTDRGEPCGLTVRFWAIPLGEVGATEGSRQRRPMTDSGAHWRPLGVGSRETWAEAAAQLQVTQFPAAP